MHNDIQYEVFPFISDPASVALQIKELLIVDISISKFERERLLSFLSANSIECCAFFIAETLIFGMSRCFVSAGKNVTNSPPLIDDIILTTNPPIPERTFVGRETELSEIDLLLETVNYHTMSAGLLGRLLSYKSVSPTDLVNHLQDNVLLPENQSKLSVSKDNVTVRSEYQSIMQDLLQYDSLTPAQQQILSIIGLAPEIGFPLRYLSISSCKQLWNNLLAECQDIDSGTVSDCRQSPEC